MQDCPEAKKPCKGILKTSSSFDRPNASYRKSAKFDEVNVLQTYHPADKDYGHMKIDEPKTPYNYVDPEHEPQDQLDASLLAEKLRIAANAQAPNFGPDDLSDDDFPETDVEKVRRIEFERRRKAHYNEFEAVRLARKLIEEELNDSDEEEELTAGDESTGKSKTSTDYLLSESSQGRNAAEELDGAAAIAVELDEEHTAGSELTGDATSVTGRHNAVDRSMDVDLPLDPTHPCAQARANQH